ncbi:hypothetical protein HMPREF0591_1437 [Mycobacterium parascrofulaceum ATCC BAA-614]|uniref:Uncharacterized protein n=1 Tax=Mycobacterium parascrofulaceum ATCC BAA-614 TaxID=525368 RepID=D5P5J3_9MYCO|nr:hypothetical protein HMPREF0591_1437 [Mycobacterium parascrofulaceum ATCC BAA-614]
MARASDEISRLFYGLREDLDQIDLHAHEEIQQLMKQEQLLGSAAMWAEINAVVAKARAAATAAAAETAAAITTQGQHIGVNPKPDPGGNGAGKDPVDATLREMQNHGFGPGGGGPGGPRAAKPAGFTNVPESPAPAPPPDNPPPKFGNARDGTGPTGDAPGAHGDPLPGARNAVGDDLPDPHKNPPKFGTQRNEVAGSLPGGPLPFTGTSGGSPMPIGNPGGGGGVPGLSMPSGPSGLPAQGLSGGAGLPGAAGLTPPTGVAPPAAPTDFSRGLGAGLGAGPAPLAPPVMPSSAAPASAGPAGAYAPGPAPVAASGGALAAPSPVPVSPVAPAAPGGGGVPAGPAGALPPFGSDVPRTAVAASGAAVSSASGAPLAPSAAGGGSSASPSVTPLPPGVVGSGIGASAGAASEGVRSARPDPLLESTSQLVYQLVHACQKTKHFVMDWCVGVFHTQSGVETVVVNSDGAGYIPSGVFVPRSVRMLFADVTLSPGFRERWFSWANPAETMLAYAELATKNNPGVELWALAVSTSYGGSSVPARAAGIAQCEDCPVDLSPLKDTDPAMALDESHMHRLETVDRGLYARLTGFGDGPLPDPSEAWRVTQQAAEAALGHAGAVRDLAVPPVIREILATLRDGVPVKAERWAALATAYFETVGMGTALRPGLFGSDGPASAHVRALFDLARLIEILLRWNLDDTTDGPRIKYPEIAYAAMQITDSVGASRG